MSAIAFIGLGQMGAPMAKNLLKQGHQLQVFDVNPQAVQIRWRAARRRRQRPRRPQRMPSSSLPCCPTATGAQRVVWRTWRLRRLISRRAGDRYVDHSSPANRRVDPRHGRAWLQPDGRTCRAHLDHAIAGTLLLLAGGTAEQVERATPC